MTVPKLQIKLKPEVIIGTGGVSGITSDKISTYIEYIEKYIKYPILGLGVECAENGRNGYLQGVSNIGTPR